MTIHLPEDLERYVQMQVRSGRFASEDGAIGEAVRLLRQQEEARPQPRDDASKAADAGGAAMPRRNLPLNQPPRRGLQGITPNPSRWHTGSLNCTAELLFSVYIRCATVID